MEGKTSVELCNEFGTHIRHYISFSECPTVVTQSEGGEQILKSDPKTGPIRKENGVRQISRVDFSNCSGE
jgi:hypothetical protein